MANTHSKMPSNKRCHAIAKSTNKRCQKIDVDGVGYCAMHKDYHAELPVCSCCLEVVSQAAVRRVQPGCGHPLHISCAKKWVRTGAMTCPICRIELNDEFLDVVDTTWRLRKTRWVGYDPAATADLLTAVRELLSRPDELIAHSPELEFTFVTPSLQRLTLPRGIPPLPELTYLLECAEALQDLFALLADG